MHCLNCGTELSSDARFCIHCGYPVQPDSPENQARLSRLAAAAPPPLVEKVRAANKLSGERRMVTALHMDVVHSTELARQLNPEAYEDALVGAFELVCPIIYRYEGTIARLQDDEMLVFFGAPVAHEDDPVRAVHAALDLLQDVQQYAAQMKVKYAIDFAVRLSLSSGPVSLGPVDDDLRYQYSALDGDLQQVAQVEAAKLAMNVNIAEATYRLVAPFFDCTDLGEFQVPGFSRPTHIYQVNSTKPRPEQVHGLSGLHSPFVGRQNELSELLQLTQALCAGLGRAALVLGEPGIGKSRLIAEWQASVNTSSTREQIRWIEGRCLSYGHGMTYHLVVSLLHSMVGMPLTANEPETHQALLELIEGLFSDPKRDPDNAGVQDIYPYLGHLLSLNLTGEAFERVRYLDPQAHQTMAQTAFRRVLRRLAARQPLVIILEDLHYADPASVEFLSQILPLAASERILFVLVMRLESESTGWRLTTLARETLGSRLTELNLNALNEEESRQLIANLLEIEALPEKICQVILHKAEGNPLFVEEVIRMLIDRAVIVHKDGQWSAQRHIRATDIPDNLQSLLLARIDRLPEEVKQTLRVAAVIGRQFPIKVLEQVIARERTPESK